MRIFEYDSGNNPYGSGNNAYYQNEEEIERAVDANLRTMNSNPEEKTPNHLPGIDNYADTTLRERTMATLTSEFARDGEHTLREAAMEHLEIELEHAGDITDDRVQEVVLGYAKADDKWDTPRIDTYEEEVGCEE